MFYIFYPKNKIAFSCQKLQNHNFPSLLENQVFSPKQEIIFPIKTEKSKPKIVFSRQNKKIVFSGQKRKSQLPVETRGCNFSLKLENRTFPQNHVFHQNQKIVFSRQTVYCVISPITLFFQQNSTIVFFS